jgi:hypothetical protein
VSSQVSERRRRHYEVHLDGKKVDEANTLRGAQFVAVKYIKYAEQGQKLEVLSVMGGTIVKRRRVEP